MVMNTDSDTEQPTEPATSPKHPDERTSLRPHYPDLKLLIAVLKVLSEYSVNKPLCEHFSGSVTLGANCN